MLPTFDYSSAKRTQREVVRANPYDELIDTAQDMNDGEGRPIVWAEGDMLYVRLQALYAWNARSQTRIKLPSRKPRDLRIYLQEQYGAIEDEHHITVERGSSRSTRSHRQPEGKRYSRCTNAPNNHHGSATSTAHGLVCPSTTRRGGTSIPNLSARMNVPNVSERAHVQSGR